MHELLEYMISRFFSLSLFFFSLIAANIVWIFNVCGFPSTTHRERWAKTSGVCVCVCCGAVRCVSFTMWTITSVCSYEFNQNPFEASLFLVSTIFPLRCDFDGRFSWMSLIYRTWKWKETKSDNERNRREKQKKKTEKIATTSRDNECEMDAGWWLYYVKGRKFNLQYFSIKC